MALFWLSDEAWAAIEQHLPRNQPGARQVEDRRVISGILHILKTGGRWRDVPPQYGPAKTRLTIAILAGHGAASGNASSPRSQRLVPFRTSFASTARM